MSLTNSERYIIHIGPGKTGTSAIQAWMNKHRKRLMDAGIYYPEHVADSNGVSSGHVDLVCDRISGEAPRISESKLTSVLTDFKNSGADTLLLSSEFFFLLVDELKAFLPDAHFIFYLRSPIDVAVSGYNQSVKRQGEVRVFSLPKRIGGGVLARLDRYLTKYGSSSFTVQPYISSVGQPFDVVSDFASLLGVDYRGGEPKVNPSYSYEALELKRHLNRYDIQALEVSLDQTLQSWDGGTRRFTLLVEMQDRKVIDEVKSRLDQMIEKHGLQRLNSVSDRIVAPTMNPLVFQSDEIAPCIPAIEFLAQKSPLLSQRLLGIVEKAEDIETSVELSMAFRETLLQSVPAYRRIGYRILNKLRVPVKKF